MDFEGFLADARDKRRRATSSCSVGRRLLLEHLILVDTLHSLGRFPQRISSFGG